MEFKNLPGWNKLTKKEKKRLAKIAKPRKEQNYNMGGELSISKKELEREK